MTSESIESWFDEIALNDDDETKIKNITKIKLHFLAQEDLLLDSPYFQELLSYSSDTSIGVRESIANFIEEVGKKFQVIIPDVLPPLSRLVCDKTPAVSKPAIRASSLILKSAYKWISVTPKVELTEIEAVFKQLNTLKSQTIKMVDSDNEGVRIRAIKFIENVVLLQTYQEPESLNFLDDVSLDDISFALQKTFSDKLEEEACKLVDELIDYLKSSHITSINLMISMGSLGKIAKFRPKFTAKVIEALINLRKELPPTLSTSQIVGIQKESLRLLETLTSIVKIKDEPGGDNKSPVKRQLDQLAGPQRKKLKTMELSEDSIAKNLTVSTVAEMVIEGIVRVPSDMTPQQFAEKFPRFYVSESADLQRRSIAKLLVTQLEQSKKVESIYKIKASLKKSYQESPVAEPERSVVDSEFVMFKLAKNLGSPLSPAAREKILLGTIDRIISSGNSIFTGQVESNKVKILLRMATINPEIKKLLLMYVSEDVKRRLDLALSLVYEEYALSHGFKNRVTIEARAETIDPPYQTYNDLLNSIVSIIESHQDKELLLTQFYLAVPMISPSMINSLTTKAIPETMNLLKELIYRRPTNKLEYLKILLGHTVHHDSNISNSAVGVVWGLYNHGEFRETILKYLKTNLDYLKLENPPLVLQGNNLKLNWTDFRVQSCLRLYRGLLKKDKSLINEVVELYPSITAHVKKPVKTLMEQSIRYFEVNSPEFLNIVEFCPKGAECLVTRFVHTLTENKIPSSELVTRMQEIYETRKLDVVFLVPVLRGLKRQEVFSMLPKLLTRNTQVTKEVIKRLFFDVEHTELLITPTEFLITVHNFNKEVADLKTVMICISLCLSEKEIFTEQVLKVAIDSLLKQKSLPVTLMRTVIQTLSIYPEMKKFTVEVLHRLVVMKIWKRPTLWRGFAKCCEILKEKSFDVVHQLPEQAINDLFVIAPGIKDDYINYCKPKPYNEADNENGRLKKIPFICIV